MDVIDIKKRTYESILSGDMSERVLANLQQENGQFIAKECEFWDYKQEFGGTHDALMKLLKSIVSLHNTFGGYIIFGIAEIQKDTRFDLLGIQPDSIDQQQLRSLFDKHFGRRLDVSYNEHLVMNKDTEELVHVGLLHVPKRDYGTHTVTVVKDAQDYKNRKILEKHAVYIRKVDECVRMISEEDYEFAVSRRDPFEEANFKLRKKIISHNLPDKNFICPEFIGRGDIIHELWAWLADDFQYTKVLAAEGGKGKTSIAYTFGQLIAKSGTDLFEQVLWLTAKKKQFVANQNDYVNTPETHYSDLKTLLKEVCIRTGTFEDEANDLEIHQLQRIARDSLNLIPSFLIIDDIDSNSPEEQRRIMDCARAISSNHSRILMTTRVNNIYSSDTSILVPGLSGNEYSELVRSNCKRLHISDFNEKKVSKLEQSSEGSPLYTDSILRLCKLGYSLENAIKEWKGKSGDSVREAALRKEVSELSVEAIKVLLAICHAGSLSRTEIHQYTDLGEVELNDALQQLDSLFLIQSREFIKEEPRFESTSSISNLVVSIAPDILPNAADYLRTLKEIEKGLKARTTSNVREVGLAISQCNALLLEERYDDAEKTIKALISLPRYKENGDLYLMLAKISYDDPDSEIEDTRRLCNEAYIKGQRKPLLFEIWYQTEISNGNKSAARDVCNYAMEELGPTDTQWSERYVFRTFDVAMSTPDFIKKIKLLIKCYDKSSRLIKLVTGPKWHDFKDLNVNIVDTVWIDAKSAGEFGVGVRAVINAIFAGDKRTVNFNRILEASNRLLLNKSDDVELLKELHDCLLWSPKLLREETGQRDSLLSELEAAQSEIQSLMSSN
ncbi:MAG: ATP-binding protein [Pseudomonadota bacterium]|nr:ATP-binding protein [Pseudomonadota bacterium]